VKYASVMGEQKIIQNCEVNFKKQCPLTWDSLTKTADESVRHCSTCDRLVHYCSNREEVEAHTLNNDCIAITAKAKHNVAGDFIVGEPESSTQYGIRNNAR